jgi:hypothetical protein
MTTEVEPVDEAAFAAAGRVFAAVYRDTLEGIKGYSTEWARTAATTAMGAYLEAAQHPRIWATLEPEPEPKLNVALLGRNIGTVYGRADWDLDAVRAVLREVEKAGIRWLGDPRRPIRAEIETEAER